MTQQYKQLPATLPFNVSGDVNDTEQNLFYKAIQQKLSYFVQNPSLPTKTKNSYTPISINQGMLINDNDGHSTEYPQSGNAKPQRKAEIQTLTQPESPTTLSAASHRQQRRIDSGTDSDIHSGNASDIARSITSGSCTFSNRNKNNHRRQHYFFWGDAYYISDYFTTSSTMTSIKRHNNYTQL